MLSSVIKNKMKIKSIHVSPFIHGRIECVCIIGCCIILSIRIKICNGIVRITATIIVLDWIRCHLRLIQEHKIIDVIPKILRYDVVIFTCIVQHISIVIFVQGNTVVGWIVRLKITKINLSTTLEMKTCSK